MCLAEPTVERLLPDRRDRNTGARVGNRLLSCQGIWHHERRCSRSWLARGGNIARNRVTIRSNYLREGSIPFYVESVAMYVGLTRELNFNLMHSKRTMVDVIQLGQNCGNCGGGSW